MSIAEIIVNFEKIKKINPYIFGHNTLAYDRCKWHPCVNDGRFTNFGAGQWNPVLGRPNAVLLDLAKKIKVSVLRFPGGSGHIIIIGKKLLGLSKNVLCISLELMSLWNYVEL